MIEMIKESVVLILHTHDGARVGMHCLWHGTVKVEFGVLLVEMFLSARAFQFNVLTKTRVKALANENTLLRTHCCSWCFLSAQTLKRAGHKMNVVLPCCANWETFVADTKCFWTKSEICVPDTKFVSATNVARAGKRGNICVGKNVPATMCPRLPGL